MFLNLERMLEFFGELFKNADTRSPPGTNEIRNSRHWALDIDIKNKIPLNPFVVHKLVAMSLAHYPSDMKNIF